RLILVGATSIELGKSTEIEVRGVRADGTSAAVTKEALKLTGDGVGTIDALTAGVYRYNAPGKGETKFVGSTAHPHASLQNYPKVCGAPSTVIAGEAPPPAPATPPQPMPPVKPLDPGTPPTNPPANPPVNPPTATKPAAADPMSGLVWTNGLV